MTSTPKTIRPDDVIAQMTDEEYAYWVETGKFPTRLAKVRAAYIAQFNLRRVEAS